MQKTAIEQNQPAISAIIPMYNEAGNIARVMGVLRECDFLSELLLVDDGSEDDTVRVVAALVEKDARIRLLRHKKNLGKGQAIFTALAETSAPILVLLDADLHELTPQHVRALLDPVLLGKADMTLGLFRKGHLNTDLSHWMTPFLTGQRALRAEILQYLSPEAAAGYGFEVALTVAASQMHYRRRIVVLKGVWHPPSEFHRGGWNGFLWRMRMYGQIIRGWVFALCHRYPRLSNLLSNSQKS